MKESAFVLLTILILSIFAFLPNIAIGESEKSSGVYKLAYNGKTYEIPYTITNAKLSTIKADQEFSSLLISVHDSQRDGWLEITLPRELLNYKNDKLDYLVVLVDGNENKRDVLYKDKDIVSIRFDIPAGSTDVEIINSPLGISPFSTSLHLSDGIISRGEVLTVGCSFYDYTTDVKSVEFKIRITGPLPKDREIFSDIISVENGGTSVLQIDIAQGIEPGQYNITMSSSDSSLTKLDDFTTFTVKGPAFVPMDIQYIVPSSTTKLHYIYTDRNSVMFVDTNSSGYGWYTSAETKTIKMSVFGEDGTRGYMTLVIPRGVMDGIKDVKIVPATNSEYKIDTNSTHTIITMNYPHTGKEMDIIIQGTTMIPEFPVSIIVAAVAIGATTIMMRAGRLEHIIEKV